MDPITLAAGWALDAAKKAVEDPKGLADLVHTIEQVASAPTKAKEQERLKNMTAQSERAQRLLGTEQFQRATEAYFFKDWLEGAVRFSGDDRFSSDFCLIALQSIIQRDSQAQEFLHVAKYIHPEDTRAFVIWIKELGSPGFTGEILEHLDTIGLFSVKRQSSWFQKFMGVVAKLTSLLLFISIPTIFILLFGSQIIDWFGLFPSPDDPSRSESDIVIKWMFMLITPTLILSVIWLASQKIYSSIEKSKPKTLTQFGISVRDRILALPDAG